MASIDQLLYAVEGVDEVLEELGYVTTRQVLAAPEGAASSASAFIGPAGYVIRGRIAVESSPAGGTLIVVGGAATCPVGSFPALGFAHRATRASWGAGFACPDTTAERVWCGLVWKAPIGALDASEPERLAEYLAHVIAQIGAESRDLASWVVAVGRGFDLVDALVDADDDAAADVDLSLLRAAVGTPPTTTRSPTGPMPVPAEPMPGATTDAAAPAEPAAPRSRIRW